jgi:hypothetical protein
MRGQTSRWGVALAIRLENFVADSCNSPDGEPLTVTCGHAVLDARMTAADALARSDATLRAIKEHGRASAFAAPVALA